MNFGDYQQATAATANPQDDPPRILNWALGLAGETGEIIEHILDPYPDDETEDEPTVLAALRLAQFACQLAEAVKKATYHGKGSDFDFDGAAELAQSIRDDADWLRGRFFFDTDLLHDGVTWVRPQYDPAPIGKEAGDLLWYTARLADELGLDLGQIAADNLAKLRERHGSGGFSGDYQGDSTPASILAKISAAPVDAHGFELDSSAEPWRQKAGE